LWSESPKGRGKDAYFQWAAASQYLHIPVIQGLFHRLINPATLRSLQLEELLDWTGAALNRVDRANFFSAFHAGQAVQYFYEPFLEAFDPELRKELGVWYTPPEIVRYMVARVDGVLRGELGIEDGLADDNVYILDPACGTGAYLIEALRYIYEVKKRDYGEAQAANAVRTAVGNKAGKLTGRVFGFEILTAPFVVAHLQLGLFLQEKKVPLEDEDRAGVYLTNALTGWEPGGELTTTIQELRQESGDADQIKQGRKILVVLGNPPYNAFAGTSPQAERIQEDELLVDRYKQGLREKWGIRKYNLDELYVRFFRIAERSIAEFRGEGVICYITNFSYLNGDSFVVMREHFMREFDQLWFDNLNGDSRETGKKTPNGNPDPSVFSTETNTTGIRKGTAICTLIRYPKDKRLETPSAAYRSFWGEDKRGELLESLARNEPSETTESDYQYQPLSPVPENRYSFRPLNISAEYQLWPLVTEIAAAFPYNGPIERRGNSLIAYMDQKDKLLGRVQAYLDASKSNANIQSIEPRFMNSSGEFDAVHTRKGLLTKEIRHSGDKIVNYPFKPFDIRSAYLDAAIAPLFSRPSPELLELREIPNNQFFITRDSTDTPEEGSPFYFSSMVCDYDFLRGHARHFPMFVKATSNIDAIQRSQPELFDREVVQSTVRANFSPKTARYLSSLAISDVDSETQPVFLIWLHALAIGYSPQYLSENEDGVQSNWPRIPLPNSAELLRQSAGIGEEIASLLNTEKKATGVTGGNIRGELRRLGIQAGSDLAITARWGYVDGRGAVMPGSGDARQREYIPEELEAIKTGCAELGLALDDALELLGDTTFDLHLNDTTCWLNIPANVYGYVIGGYQVIKKWLSYRNSDVLDRALTDAESLEVTHMTRRIAAILLMTPRLNQNYRDVAENVYEWPK